MKKTILLVMLVFAFACDKDDHDNETLPPATQSGKGTFACYVDGKPFIDKSGGWFNCYYQLVEGEYYFSIGDNSINNLPQNIYIQTDKKRIFEGETYQLLELSDGNTYAGCGFSYSITENYQSYTNSNYSGELTITKLDFTSHIVSGTFWFDVKHPITGETVEIREGRFDTLFTQ